MSGQIETDATTSLDDIVVQTVYAEDATQQAKTGPTPGDDTIPQVTEGQEYLSLQIKPRRNGSRLRVTVELMAANGAVSTTIVQLHRDGAADAAAAWYAATSTVVGMGKSQLFIHEEPTGSLDTTTFALRLGNDATVTVYTNGPTTGRRYGGSMVTAMTIEEIGPS